MIGTSVRAQPETSSLLPRPALLLIGAGVAVLMLVGAAIASLAAVVAATPSSATLSTPDGASDLPLRGEVNVSLSGWDTRLEYAALYETPVGPDGSRGVERPIPIQANVARTSWWPEGSEFALNPTSGTLSADANYRLVVLASALGPDVPLPRALPIQREVRFSTVRSPSPQAMTGPIRLKWAQPLQIRWDAPVEDVRYEVTPPTPIRTSIDPADRRTSSVVLENPADGETYKIVVAAARGANGIPLARPAEYAVTAPTRPKLADAEEPRTVELGIPLTLRLGVPIDRVNLAIEPPVTSSWEVDRRDPTVVQVKLDGLAQGESYELAITEAVSRDGAPLTEPPTLTLQTPERLMVDDLDTGADGGRVSVKAKPTIIFAQPIRDRRAAVAAISVDPPMPGTWEWLDDQHVQFSPTRTLPYDAEITFKIKPGPDGPRSVAGAYFENQPVLSFTTETDKVIDVDVTRQIMTLYQQGRQVRTFMVGTGVPGADTPIGEFTVEYKMPKARFQGVNVNGSRYDIPDVKWVLAFMGDYTIHGAYWRSTFGVPGSNGCVGLTDDDAKIVYDWAPEGTRINIHY